MAKADGRSVATAGADPILRPGALVVRRSVFIAASPERVWHEFESFERMNGWWGAILGAPEAGKSKGHHLRVYEPRLGGRIEMQVSLDGAPARYGGPIVVYEPGRELTFENDWIPNQGWAQPTRITLRLNSVGSGTVVEVLHYGFEGASAEPGAEHAGYEGGWGMTQLNALREAIGAGAEPERIEPGALVVRRSIEIKATPERVWREFETPERFSAWWTTRETDRREGVRVYEPRPGGRVEMPCEWDGGSCVFVGTITSFLPHQELTWELSIEGESWAAPTYVTVRLTPNAYGTLVEILHYGFERIGNAALGQFLGFEGGWDMRELRQLRATVEAA